MIWALSHRADRLALPLADRHYNRQKPGTPQFVPPGRCLVFLAPAALWVTSWPFAEYVKHAWAGAWINSCFRREAGPQASDLIREAIAATKAIWGDPPPLGMVTFVDASQVRRKRDPGRCYRKAGFNLVGETKGGLLAWQLLPENMPDAELPIGANLQLVAVTPGTDPPEWDSVSIEQQIAELKAAGWIPLTGKCWKAPAGSGCAGYFLGPHGAWKAMKRRSECK